MFESIPSLILFFFLIFIGSFYWEFSHLNKKIENEYFLKSVRIKFKIWTLVFPAILTYIFLSIEDLPLKELFITFFWVTPFIQVIKYFYFIIKKPSTVFISGNKFIINKRKIISKSITELSEIFYDKYSNTMTLRFNHIDLKLKLAEYELEEFKSFLKILISRSGNSIDYPTELLTKLKMEVD